MVVENSTSKQFERLHKRLIRCRACPGLVAFREEISKRKRRQFRDETYWGRPVPGFGDIHARVVIIGLAPGAHGSNRTGRMFTGDASGRFLYRALYEAGFASQPVSSSKNDGLELYGCYISAVVRCVPPANRPTSREITQCLPWLKKELTLLSEWKVILALGRIAHQGVLKLFHIRQSLYPFKHGALYDLGQGRYLIDSYHVSQQNTATRRLTMDMFMQVLDLVKKKAGIV